MAGVPHIEIREARLPADGEGILGLYRESAQWHAEQWPNDIRPIDDSFLRSMLPELSNLDENTFLRVAEYAGALVGLISARVRRPPAGGRSRYDGPIVWVGDVVVTESARQQGIGSQLMAAVEAWARGRGAGSITLSVHAGNDPALRLYERNGYRTTEHRLRKDL